MKYFWMAVLATLCAGSLAAQTADKPSKRIFSGEISGQKVLFGVRGGISFSSFGGDIRKVWEGDFTEKAVVGWNAGIVFDCPMLKSLYFQPGLFVKTKDFGMNEANAEYSREIAGRSNYLVIPLLFSYRYDIKKNLQCEFNFGPFIGNGLSGRVSDTKKFNGGETSGDTWFNPEYGDAGKIERKELAFFGDDLEDSFGLNRFDTGLCFGVGITVSHFYFGVQYDLGLANIANRDCWNPGTKFHTHNFSIMLGFNLGSR